MSGTEIWLLVMLIISLVVSLINLARINRLQYDRDWYMMRYKQLIEDYSELLRRKQP